MSIRLPNCAPLLLILPVLAATACESNDPSPTAPVALSGTLTGTLHQSFRARPTHARPEFLHDAPCPVRPAFGLRVTVVVGGPGDVILRGLRFRFTDRFGVSTLPDVIPIPEHGSLSIPSTMPIPIPGVAALPTASPIPIPGATPITGILVAGGASRPLPFFARFGCGVVPEGTMVISAEGSDAKGHAATSELRVRVGG